MTEPTEPDYRRELYGCVLLLVIGSGLMLWLAGRSWLTVQVDRQPPFGPLTLGVTGRHLYPALTGFAVVGLLAALLILVTGAWPRRVLGLLLIGVAASTGTFADSFLFYRSYHHKDLIGDRAGVDSQLQSVTRHAGWGVASLVCSFLILAAAGLLVRRAGRWPAGLSRRYAAPAEAAAAPDPWRQLDRGEDPTIGNG